MSDEVRDDNAETIKKRLDVYHNQTAPLIEWYKAEGIHHHINGLGELPRIFGDICAVIDALSKYRIPIKQYKRGAQFTTYIVN